MQIDTNTSGMPAGLCVTADKDGRDHCIAVVKGTFAIDPDGGSRLAEEQEPLVYADVHFGDPEVTAVRYECDFAPNKPRTDILLNAVAHAPRGKPAERLTATFEIAGARKSVLVIGDRHFYRSAVGVGFTEPLPFLTMPITFDRAFGGRDESHPNPKNHGAEMRNLVGRGFWKGGEHKAFEGKPLPNVEDPHNLFRALGDAPPPVGFGVVGRGAQPRIAFAGTYDQRWLDDKFPFLPDDFDPRYFQSAPADQQVTALRGGEVLRCTNMTPEGLLETKVPVADVPFHFVFRDRKERVEGRMDTLLIEPDRRRLILTWRASVPLGRKLNALREVIVGRRALSPSVPATTDTPKDALPPGVKPHFASIDEYVAWKKRHEGQ